MPIAQAAHDGTRQVVPALFASTTTTIAVFLPVLFLKDVEGQIFADLALTISIAVAFSIMVAITVVPAAAGRWLGAHSKNSGYGAGWPWLTDRVIAWTRTRKQQLGWVGALLVAPLAAVVAAAAQARLSAAGEARGDRCVLQLPARHEPGGGRIARSSRKLLERMEPYMKGEKEPRLKNWYVLLWPGGGTIGARVDRRRPHRRARAHRARRNRRRPSRHARVRERGRAVRRHRRLGALGGDPPAVHRHRRRSMPRPRKAASSSNGTFPGANVQSFPNADVQALELRAEPNDRRIAEVGWDRASLGTVVRALGDGAWLGEYFDGQTRLAGHPAREPGRDARRAGAGAVDHTLGRDRVARRAGEPADDAGARADPPHRSSPHRDADDRSAADAVAGRHAREDRQRRSCLRCARSCRRTRTSGSRAAPTGSTRSSRRWASTSCWRCWCCSC